MESLVVLQGSKVSFTVKGQIVPGTLSSHLTLTFISLTYPLRRITILVAKMLNNMRNRIYFV